MTQEDYAEAITNALDAIEQHASYIETSNDAILEAIKDLHSTINWAAFLVLVAIFFN